MNERLDIEYKCAACLKISVLEFRRQKMSSHIHRRRELFEASRLSRKSAKTKDGVFAVPSYYVTVNILCIEYDSHE